MAALCRPRCRSCPARSKSYMQANSPLLKGQESRSAFAKTKFRGVAGSELVWELRANLISSTLPLKLTSGAGNGIKAFS
jgi:hypothetical protein